MLVSFELCQSFFFGFSGFADTLQIGQSVQICFFKISNSIFQVAIS